MSNSKENARYPYTYAADYLRMKIGWDKGLISRAAASRARKLVAEALGFNDRSVAEILAEKYIEKYGN